MNPVNTITEAVNNLSASSIALEKMSHKQRIYNKNYAAYLQYISDEMAELAYDLQTFNFVYGGI
jgi:hypothetical protein